MIPPDKLFSLPQDVYLERGKPKSTPEQVRAFREKVSKMKFKKDRLIFTIFVETFFYGR